MTDIPDPVQAVERALAERRRKAGRREIDAAIYDVLLGRMGSKVLSLRARLQFSASRFAVIS